MYEPEACFRGREELHFVTSDRRVFPCTLPSLSILLNTMGLVGPFSLCVLGIELKT